jgi:hypothetical protein
MAHEIGALPPLPPDRSRALRRRPTLSHDDRRVAHHFNGYVDPERTQTANMHIVAGRWASLLGDPNAAVVFKRADVVRFPATR